MKKHQFRNGSNLSKYPFGRPRICKNKSVTRWFKVSADSLGKNSWTEYKRLGIALWICLLFLNSLPHLILAQSFYFIVLPNWLLFLSTFIAIVNYYVRNQLFHFISVIYVLNFFFCSILQYNYVRFILQEYCRFQWKR